MTSSPRETPPVDPVYDRLAATPEFHELRSRYLGFVMPATIAFISWYALYVVMSMFAGGFMNKTVVGNINVALVFGLLQFVTTFGIAWLYSNYSDKRLDPLAEKLRAEFDAPEAAPGKRIANDNPNQTTGEA